MNIKRLLKESKGYDLYVCLKKNYIQLELD